MKIKMSDGTVVEKRFSADAAVGYRCTSIEIDAADAMAMWTLVVHGSRPRVEALFAQFAHRFEDNRVARP